MKRLLSLALAFLLVFGGSFEAKAATDLVGHFAQQQMESFMARGFITGFPDGTVRPNNPITRAEFYTFVNRAFGFMQLAPIGFSDVRPDDWYFQEISRAQAAGYIIAGTLALPNQQITREEAAVVIHRISGLTPFEAGAGQFSDVPFAWTRPYIGAVVSAGFMQGFPDGTFRPHAPITRGEAVVVLTRAMNRVSGLDISFIPPAEGNLNPLTFATPGQNLATAIPRQSDFTNFAMVMNTSSLGGGNNDRNLSGSLLVDTASGSLRDMDISGDLVFSERTNGNFTLSNVHVSGNIYIFGNPRIVLDNSFARELVVNGVRTGASVTLRRMSEIGTARLFSAASLSEDILSNRHLGFTDIIVEFGFSRGERVLLSGNSNRITINERAVVRLDRGHSTNLLIDANAERTVFELGTQASIDFAEINGASSQFTGTGRIRMADVRANGVTFQRRPETLLGYQGAGWWGPGGPGSGWGSSGFWDAPDWWSPGWWDNSGWWGSGNWWGSGWGPDHWMGDSWYNDSWWNNTNWWGHPGWWHGPGWSGVGGSGQWDHQLRVRILNQNGTPIDGARVEMSITHLGVRRSIGSGLTNADGDVFPWLPTGWRGDVHITVTRDGFDRFSETISITGRTITINMAAEGSGSGGGGTTPAREVRITTAPTQPSVPVPSGTEVTLRVVAEVHPPVTPAPTLTYQWYWRYNGTAFPIEGATAAEEVFTMLGTTQFRVEVSAQGATSRTSDWVTVEVSPPVVARVVNIANAPTTGAAATGQTANGLATGQHHNVGAVVALNAGTRTGFTFNNWTIVPAGITISNPTNLTTASFEVPEGSGAITVTANWTANSVPPTPTINIDTPPANVTVTQGSISGDLTVAATVAPSGTPTFQWFSNTTASNTGGTEVSGATGASFTIPTGLTAGAHHYFVEVRATGADSVRSDAVTVTVNPPGAPVARLSALGVTGQTLTPAFAEGDFSYTLTVPSSTSAVTITATGRDGATVEMTSGPVGGAQTAVTGGAVTLDNSGVTEVRVTATLSGVSQVYTITINHGFLVNITNNPVAGAVPNGQTATGGRHLAGATVNIDAGSRTGFDFINWTAPGITFVNDTNATTSFTMPTAHANITANWGHTLSGARNAAIDAINALMLSNTTDAAAIMAAVNGAIANPSPVITPSWHAPFNNDASPGVSGSITGTIRLTQGGNDVDIVLGVDTNGAVPALISISAQASSPLPSAAPFTWVAPTSAAATSNNNTNTQQSLSSAATAAQAAVNALSVSNTITAENVMAVVNGAITNSSITASWHVNAGFTKIPATAVESGAITGRIVLRNGSNTTEVVISRTIPALTATSNAPFSNTTNNQSTAQPSNAAPDAPFRWVP